MGESSGCSWISLIETVEQIVGHRLAEGVRDAFLRVDRRRFVPQYYVQEGHEWVRHEAGPEIYENRAFFVRRDKRGIPNSSSSQPSLMAPMLEALDVRPGHRVLEIGTGTGYNAALLAELVGSAGRVVSVDIAEDLIECAATRLLAWPQVKAVASDGLLGSPKEAPYDRIIATGGAPFIPRPWIDQLTVGGILLGTLTLGLSTATPLYRLVKQADGSAHGSLLPTPAFFMQLYQQEKQVLHAPDLGFYEAQPVLEHAWTTLDLPRELKDPRLAIFVSEHISGLESLLHVRAHPQRLETCLLLPHRTLLSMLPSADESFRFEIEVRGTEPMWGRLLDIHTKWEKLGRPVLSRYHIMVDRKGQLTLALR